MQITQDNNHPLALQVPKPLFPIYTVSVEDAHQIQANLWQDRSVEDIQAFIKRVLIFQSQKRGTGIIVRNDTLENQPIIGYGQVTQWLQCAEISDLFVHSDYRSHGIGTAIIQYLTRYTLLESVSTCVELGVAESNPRALVLYRRLGFADSYNLQLDLGYGSEPVIYLRLDLNAYR